MNVYELDTLCMKYCGLKVTDANRTEYSDMFLAAYNEAYEDVILNRYRPYKFEQIDVSDSRLTPSDLSSEHIEVLGIFDDRDAALVNNNIGGYSYYIEDSDSIFIDNCQDKSVYVLYKYMPELLTNDSPTDTEDKDTPILPGRYHQLFSAYAASRWLASEQKLGRADYFYEIYVRGRARVRSMKSVTGARFHNGDNYELL